MARKLTMTATMALVVGAIAGAAWAQAPGVANDAPRAHVSFADLNLSSASGRARLNNRISAAAAAMCGPGPSIRDLAGLQSYRACLKATISSSTPTPDQAADLQANSQPRFAQASEQ